MTREEAIHILDNLKPTNTKTSFDAYVVSKAITMAIKALEQEPKTGHWIRISPAEIYECSECGQNVMTSDICVYKFCHRCGAKMESEDNE